MNANSFYRQHIFWEDATTLVSFAFIRGFPHFASFCEQEITEETEISFSASEFLRLLLFQSVTRCLSPFFNGLLRPRPSLSIVAVVLILLVRFVATRQFGRGFSTVECLVLLQQRIAIGGRILLIAQLAPDTCPVLKGLVSRLSV